MKNFLAAFTLLFGLTLAQGVLFEQSYDADEWDQVIEQKHQREYEDRHAPTTLPPGLELGNYRLIRERSTCRVIGQIINNSEYTFEAVTVRVAIMDSAGQLLDTGTDTIRNLPPGQVWVFETNFLEDSATDFKITQVEIN